MRIRDLGAEYERIATRIDGTREKSIELGQALAAASARLEALPKPRPVDELRRRLADAEEKLPLEEFYEEYSRRWRHVLDVRYRERGKLRTYVQLGAALATGRVTVGAVRKVMNLAKVFSRKETFLAAHREDATA